MKLYESFWGATFVETILDYLLSLEMNIHKQNLEKKKKKKNLLSKCSLQVLCNFLGKGFSHLWYRIKNIPFCYVIQILTMRLVKVYVSNGGRKEDGREEG